MLNKLACQWCQTFAHSSTSWEINEQWTLLIDQNSYSRLTFHALCRHTHRYQMCPSYHHSYTRSIFSYPLFKRLLITLVGHVECHKNKTTAPLNVLHVECFDLSVSTLQPFLMLTCVRCKHTRRYLMCPSHQHFYTKVSMCDTLITKRIVDIVFDMFHCITVHNTLQTQWLASHA